MSFIIYCLFIGQSGVAAAGNDDGKDNGNDAAEMTPAMHIDRS